MKRTTHRRRSPRTRQMRLVIESLERRAVPSSSALLTAAGTSLTSRPPVAASGFDQGTPTRHELLRQQFVARFKGPFVTGRPRFQNEASQTYLYGGGNSSAFLHGDLQLAFSTPTDPNQLVQGQATMIVKNVANTGNVLTVDLVEVPGARDRAGRPTQFTWTQNPSSGGTFTNGSGSGTVAIQYRHGARLPLRATSAGTAGALFRGQLFTTGISNTLRNQ